MFAAHGFAVDWLNFASYRAPIFHSAHISPRSVLPGLSLECRHDALQFYTTSRPIRPSTFICDVTLLSLPLCALLIPTTRLQHHRPPYR